jgi:hypothetical protein
MEKNTSFPAKFSNFTDGLLYPDFIVNVDNRKGECVRSDSCFQLVKVDYAICLYG